MELKKKNQSQVNIKNKIALGELLKRYISVEECSCIEVLIFKS